MTENQRLVLGVTAAVALLVVLDALVVSTALSTIRLHLHASVTQLEWTVNGYTLSFAALLMTAAVLGDRFGRRRVLSLGLALFAAASAPAIAVYGGLALLAALAGAAMPGRRRTASGGITANRPAASVRQDMTRIGTTVAARPFPGDSRTCSTTSISRRSEP